MRTNRFIDIYLPTSICLAATISALLLGLTHGISDKDEVEYLDLTIKEIFYKDGYRQSPHYDFIVEEYPNTFRIPADFTKLINKAQLWNSISKKHKLTIGISIDQSTDLKTQTDIMVYSICHRKLCSLELEEVLTINNQGRKYGTPLLTLVLGIITLIVYVTRKRKYG